MDYKAILKSAELPDGTVTKSRKFAGASKSLRRNIIRDNDGSEEARICAAIEIQRVFRGYCSRCRLLNVLEPVTSKTAIYGESKHQLARLKDFRTPTPKVFRSKSGSSVSSNRTRLEEYYNTYVNRMLEAGSSPTSDRIMSYKDFCANYIQNWWHQVKQEKSFVSKEKTIPEYESARPRQKPKRTEPLTNPDAVIVIQRAWRRHIDIQVYRYYRDLINFKQKGDPSMMLKCINPNEAKFLDPAAGIHIKFRLAGERFPPNIYYKIFTHRPVQDLCANSPKDYTSATTKRLQCRELHNKSNKAPPADKNGWYQRSENNGWRLVSDRLLQHVTSDPVTWTTSHQKVEFHHNKLQRREDIEKNKKRKKIEWMRKMYKDGLLKAKVEDKETVNLIEGAAAGMVATVDTHGPEAVQDWEVDELLNWTTGLSFEDYWSDWKELATSSKSENNIRGGLFAVSDRDPYDISVSQGVSRGNDQSTSRVKSTSTRPSHNTPTSSETRSAISGY